MAKTMQPGIRSAVLTAVLTLYAGGVIADLLPERRRDQFGGDFSYYFYPIAGEVPGLGRAAGGGASILNIGGSDADFTAFKLDGDFSASGYVFLDLPVVRRRLVADAGVYDFNVTQPRYGRGIDSLPDNYILPHVAGHNLFGQLTLTFDERRYESYLRLLDGHVQLVDVRDNDGRTFPAINTERQVSQVFSIGGSIDFTDDRLDPRRGLRIEAAVKKPYIGDALMSEYVVSDLNLTGYLPLRRGRDTLVFNYFQSDAHITRRGEIDYATLKAGRGLNCDALTSPEERIGCYSTEERYLNELIAANRYGQATALGGTQRLRSFDNGRFYAGHALSYGVEYRLNLTDERTPFDIFIARGVRTGLQLAFFAERGAVADDPADLWRRQRYSYGVGFRMVLSGVVLRADLAQGDEGGRFQLFLNYPWSMYSVDNPG